MAVWIIHLILNATDDRNWWLGITDEDINGHWMWFDINASPEYTGWMIIFYLQKNKTLFFFIASVINRHNEKLYRLAHKCFFEQPSAIQF